MSYTIKTSNNSTIAVVQDATLNTIATSLTLVGRDYAGYGAFLNENFVYLLENFANLTEPAHKITGQLWYDTSKKLLKVYDSTYTSGDGWKPISSSIAQSTAPTGSTIGDLWFDTTTYALYVYTANIAIGSNGWQLIGPPVTGDKMSGPVVETVQDSSSNNHVVIKFYLENIVTAILSKDDTFTLYTPIDGFATVNPGLNLSTAATTNGNDNQFTGSTTNALTLNGVASNQFLRSDQNTSSAYQLTLGGGLIVGTDLKIVAITANNEVRLDNLTNNRDTNFYANVGGNPTRLMGLTASTGTVNFVNGNVTISTAGDITTIGALTVGTNTTLNGLTTLKQQVLPGNVGTIDIGSSSYNFANVFAKTFYGNIVGNITANIGTISGNLTVNGSIFIASNVVAAQNWVTSYVQTSGKNSQGTRTVSSSAPTGGSDGDIWYQV